MYVFGGIDQHQERFNDIHEFCYETNAWTRVVSIGTAPSPRTFHQSLFLNGYMYILGGFDGWKRSDMFRILIEQRNGAKSNNPAGALNELEEEKGIESYPEQRPFSREFFQELPLLTWYRAKSTGSVYTPRTGHEVIIYKEKIYLFGGTDDDDRKNDIYMYDIHTNTWERLHSSGSSPTPRSGAKGVAYKDSLYFFGGYTKKLGEYYNDFHRYDLRMKKWIKLELQGTPPSERNDHSVVIYEGCMYLFGGYDGKTRFQDFF